MNRRQVVLGAGALAACNGAAQPVPRPSFLASRSVSLGNALDAPTEGEWGYRIEPGHIRAIAAAGFDGLRLPVRWDAHTDRAPPYSIAPAFLDRVEEVILMALTTDLKVQMDLHYADPLVADPEAERPRLLAIWRQIAERFSDAPTSSVIFEPINEPFGAALTGDLLTSIQKDAITTIRAVTPDRAIVVGPGNWQTISGLDTWTPPDAERLVISPHYYEPYAFTHHRISWMGAEAPIYNRTWGKSEDRARVHEHITKAAQWARSRGFAMQIGEFGINENVPLPQRALWTSVVREACEREGAAWCVWDFAGAFPIFDKRTGRFIPRMLDALFSSTTHQ